MEELIVLGYYQDLKIIFSGEVQDCKLSERNCEQTCFLTPINLTRL